MSEQTLEGIRPDVHEMIDFLNSLVKIDQAAISNLFFSRVPCNKALADHPTVQVGNTPDQATDFDLGPLGLINGFYGVYAKGERADWGAIAMDVDDGKIVKFCVTPNKLPE